jgi:hypothetical protein
MLSPVCRIQGATLPAAPLETVTDPRDERSLTISRCAFRNTFKMDSVSSTVLFTYSCGYSTMAAHGTLSVVVPRPGSEAMIEYNTSNTMNLQA